MYIEVFVSVNIVSYVCLKIQNIVIRVLIRLDAEITAVKIMVILFLKLIATVEI